VGVGRGGRVSSKRHKSSPCSQSGNQFTRWPYLRIDIECIGRCLLPTFCWQLRISPGRSAWTALIGRAGVVLVCACGMGSCSPPRSSEFGGGVVRLTGIEEAGSTRNQQLLLLLLRVETKYFYIDMRLPGFLWRNKWGAYIAPNAVEAEEVRKSRCSGCRWN
jgi:hypothetical protein